MTFLKKEEPTKSFFFLGGREPRRESNKTRLFKVSTARVSQIKESALSKLRKSIWYNSSTMAKVKMKSNRSAKKRFKITGSGKIKRWKSGGAHYNTKKSKKRKRALRKPGLVHPSWEDKVRGMLKEF